MLSTVSVVLSDALVGLVLLLLAGLVLALMVAGAVEEMNLFAHDFEHKVRISVMSATCFGYAGHPFRTHLKSGRLRPKRPAGMLRNGWPPCSEITGRHGPKFACSV